MDIAEAYKKGTTTPLEVLKRCLQSIDDLSEYKIFMEVIKKEKLYLLAKQSGERWKAGKPLSNYDFFSLVFFNLVVIFIR